MQSVTIRYSNTDDVATANSITFDALKALPDIAPIGDVGERLGGGLRNRKGGRWQYGIEAMYYSLASTSDAGSEQDHGDYVALKRAITLYRFLWLYAVSGSSRVDGSDADFWSTHALPVAVVLDGEPLASALMNGHQSFEFDLLARSMTLS